MYKDGIQFTMKGVAINKEIEAMETQSFLKTAVNVIFCTSIKTFTDMKKGGDNNVWGESSGGNVQRI